MGLEELHMPAEMKEGRFLGEVASEESLCRGALRTVSVRMGMPEKWTGKFAHHSSV